MIHKKRLVYNTFLLTGVSLLMSCIGIAFQVWLVGRIDSAGIGAVSARALRHGAYGDLRRVRHTLRLDAAYIGGAGRI